MKVKSNYITIYKKEIIELKRNPPMDSRQEGCMYNVGIDRWWIFKIQNPFKKSPPFANWEEDQENIFDFVHIT